MKAVLLSLIMIFSMGLLNAAEADDIIGTWITDGGKAHIEVYKKDGKYHGKVVWNKTPDKKDVNNPDESKRERKIRGMVILTHLKWDGEMWEKGYIYDPEKGKTYNCEASLEGVNKLSFRGYIGFSLMGRSTTWTRKTD